MYAKTGSDNMSEKSQQELNLQKHMQIDKNFMGEDNIYG